MDIKVVLYVASHLTMSISIVIAYTVLKINNVEVSTLEYILIAMAGYWFGAMDKSKFNLPGKKKGGTPSE